MRGKSLGVVRSVTVRNDEGGVGIMAVRALFINDGLYDLLEVWLVSEVGLN